MTEPIWEISKKLFYKRKWGRVCLTLLQNRDAEGSSPWFVQLDGVGSDPSTGKIPVMQLKPDVPDVVAQKLALRWAAPYLKAFVEQHDAITNELRTLLDGVDEP